MSNIYEVKSLQDTLKANSYPGRGIVVGTSPSGKDAVFAYFIMGRSANSQNRIFETDGYDVVIYPYNANKVEDPSLIIYSPVKKYKKSYVVTNGDQTDTIVEGFKNGLSFSDSLKSRTFEPDAPNLTPRISAFLNLERGYRYSMSIIKAGDKDGLTCNRFTYDYAPMCGLGHFIHTYMSDGNPLPTFQGEPERVNIPEDIDQFTISVWNNLNEKNRISLLVYYVDIKTGNVRQRIVNKNI